MNKTFVVNLLIGAAIGASLHGNFAMMAIFLLSALLCGAIKEKQEK
jgi:hypothetical protein